MFIEYTELILREYEEKRSNNKLSLRLVNPTPAKLKQECEAVFSQRYNRNDHAMLCTFFGDMNDANVGLKIIRRYETDKFKPLIKYLRKETKTTDDKNVELLAWLIDFKPRPYEVGTRYNVDDINSTNIDEEEIKPDLKDSISQPQSLIEESNSISTEAEKSSKPKTKTYIIVIAVALLLTGLVTFWFQNNKQQNTAASNFITNNACMYWEDDHYEQSDCNATHGDTLMIALDTFKLHHLKKITRPDTITMNALGSVWYIKINNKIEYFTAGGVYPLNPNKKLRPLTNYMIKKHLQPVK